MTINRTGKSKVENNRRLYESICSICGHIKWFKSYRKPVWKILNTDALGFGYKLGWWNWNTQET